MKPCAVLINQTCIFNRAPDELQALTSHPPLRKTKIALHSQPTYAKQLKKHTLQCQNSLFNKAPATAIDCQAYPSNALPDNLNDTANWTNLLEKTGHTSTGTTADFGNKAKEIYDSLMPHIQLWYQSSPDLEEVAVPVCGTLLGTLFALVAIPVSFLQFHQYISWNPLLAFLGVTTEIEVPYQNSMWNALEEPVKYLVVFMAFSQM
jgi:hypothetical protein